MRGVYAAWASALSVIAVGQDASALGPVDVEIALKVGGAWNPAAQPLYPGDPYLYPDGFGIGGRMGVSLGAVYLGISGMQYSRSSRAIFGIVLGPTGGESLRGPLSYAPADQLGFEGGYSFMFVNNRLTIRPQLGVGDLALDVTCAYFEPGVTALLSFGPVIVGADGNVLVSVSTVFYSSATITAHGQVGVRF